VIEAGNNETQQEHEYQSNRGNDDGQDVVGGFVTTFSSSSLSQLPAPMMAVLSLADKGRWELARPPQRGPVESLIEEQDSDEDGELREDEVE
jgi:hypothetical protein